MSRTVLFVAAAAALGLAALVVTPSHNSTQPAQVVQVNPALPTQIAMTGSTVTPLAADAAPVSTVNATSWLPVQLSAKLSHPVVLNGASEIYAEISLTAAQQEAGPRRPVSLALVIDRSG